MNKVTALAKIDRLRRIALSVRVESDGLSRYSDELVASDRVNSDDTLYHTIERRLDSLETAAAEARALLAELRG